MCRRKFGFISIIFILICINPLFASYKCFYLCAFKFNGANQLLVVQRSVSWPSGLVGTVGQD
jgi:hypothetical protein